MEIEYIWAPTVGLQEVEQYGIVLDKLYKVKFDKSDIEKHHTLYYLKSKDLFVTVENQTKKVQVLSDLTSTRSFREQYLGQTTVESKDNFLQFEDDTAYNVYQSDFNLTDVERIKKEGTLLETKQSQEIYYIVDMDAFVEVCKESTHPPHKFQDTNLRKKYNIPFQDERFQDFNF